MQCRTNTRCGNSVKRVAPCFFIKNSKSSAISLSVTPSLILPKTYSNAISPIFFSLCDFFFYFAFVFYFSQFVYKILHFNKILSNLLVLLLFAYFSPTLIYDSSKLIYLSSILKIFFQNRLQYQLLKAFCLLTCLYCISRICDNILATVRNKQICVL